MRKLALVVVLFFLSSFVYAQSISSYVYNYNASGTFTAINGVAGTTTVSTISSDDATQPNIPLGFNFVFAGSSTTTISACSNGWISLANSTSTTFGNSAGNVPSTGFIMPFWDDHSGTSAVAYYTTTGSAPNRVFTFQWGDATTGWNNSSAGGRGCFQVKLYESTNVIQFVYGAPRMPAGSSATIGIANSGTSGNFLTIPNNTSTTASSTTFTVLGTGAGGRIPTNGTVLTFTPPPYATWSPTTLSVTTAPSTTSTSVSSAISAFGLTSSGTMTLSLTGTNASMFQIQNPVTSTWIAAGSSTTYSATSATSGNYDYKTVNVRFVGGASTGTYTATLNYSGSGYTGPATVALTGNVVASCSGIPTAGTIVVTGAPACGSYTPTLSLTGTDPGISYQWQSSTDNATFTDVSGATSATYSPLVSSQRYFRCAVTCIASGLSSNSVSVSCLPLACMVSGATTSLTTCSATFTSSNGTSGSYTNNENGTYTFYPTVSTDKIRVAFSAFSTESGYDSLQIFDGNSTSATRLGRFSGTTLPTTFTSTAADGSLTFKFLSDVSGISSGWTAAVSCVTVPACSGTPTGGTVASSGTAACGSYSVPLSVAGATSGFTGLSYQWQSSPDNATFTPISGATNITYAYTQTTSAPLYYRRNITCATSGVTSSSSSVLPAAAYACLVSGATTSVTSCGVSFYSSNGATGSYSNSENGTITFYPSSPTNRVRATFSAFSTESGYDSLQIFDGNSTSASRIGRFMGTTSPGVISSTAADGSLTFKWQSDITGTSTGWAAAISCFAAPPSIFPSPTSLSFGVVSVGASSGVQNITISGFNLTSSGTITITASTDFKVNNGTTWVSSYSYPYTGTSISSYVIPVRFDPASIMAYSGTITISGGGLVTPVTITLTGTGTNTCSGTPATPVASATSTTICGGSTTTLSVPVPGVGGITYQWYSSSDNVTFNPIAGATNNTYLANISVTSYYQCVETCSASSLSSTSNTVTITGMIGGYAAIPFTENFETTWINFCATKDVPNSYWKNSPATSDSSWRREDDAAGANTAVWSLPGSYLYSPAFSTTAHSARFHSGYTTAGRRGILDLYVNMGSSVTKQISYDYINIDGSDFLDVYISTDGGVTFSSSLDHPTTSTAWSGRSFSTSVNSATAIIRFVATADYGTTDIGIDNVKVIPLSPTITAAPTSLAFGNVAVGASTTLSTTISGAYLSPASGTITISAPAGFTVFDGSSYVSSYSTTYSSSGATITLPTINAKFSPVSGIVYSGSITITGGGLSTPASIPVTGTGIAACSGTPTAGAATATVTSGCAPSYATTLALSGSTAASGLTYQWYSGTDGITYGTTISGATNATYNATVTTNTYYRATVTCPTYGSATSTGVMALSPGLVTPPYTENFNAAAAIPCGWTVQDVNADANTWTVGTTTSAPTGFSSPYYALYHWSVPNAGNDWLFSKGLNLTAGYIYNFTFKYAATSSFTEGIEVKWGNAASAAGMTSPVLFSNTSITGSAMVTSPVMTIIPSTSGVYYVGFHAISAADQFYLYMDDFDITVQPVCTGTPTAGTTAATVSSGCSSYSTTLSLPGASTPTSGLSFQWYKSTGAGYTVISGATSNTYTTTVTNPSESYQCVLSCSATGTSATSTPVTVTLGPVPDVITGSNSVCINQTISLANTVGGGVWSSSNTSIATINSSGVVFAQSTVGSTTISYTIGGCYSTYIVGVGNTSPAPITGTASACLGASSTLADATAGGVWSSNNTAIATVSPTTGVVTGVSNGTTTITYNNGCGTPSTTSWITNGTSVSLTYTSGGASGVVCSGGTLSLNSGTLAGGTYAWTGPNSYTSTAQNPSIANVSGLAAGMYTFSATVGGCATGNKNIFVMVDAIPTVTATSPSICPGGSTTISASSVLPAAGGNNYAVNAISYQLFDTTGVALSAGDDGTVAATIPFTFTFFGNNYTTVNISRNGYINFGASVSSDYTAYALPSTNAPRAMIALFWHDYYTTANSIKYTTVGSAPNRKFIVSYNNIPDRDASITGPSTSVFSNGQIVLYETTNVIELYVTKNNTGGAYASTCGIQNNNRAVGYSVPGQNLANYTINYPAGTGWRFSVPSYNYTWSPATALSATTGSTVTSSGLTSTTIYTVNATDIYSGCTTGGNAASTVTVNPTPTIGTTPAIACAGIPVTASGASTYSWAPATGLSATTGATVTPSAAVSTTNYTITGTSAAGCVGTGTVTVNAAPVVSVTPTSSAICAGGSATLTASGAVTYSWTSSATLSSSTSASVLATPVTTTTYSVSGVNAAGCSSLVSPGSTVTVNATPVAGALTAATGYCLGSGSPYVINTATATGPGAVSSYNWSGPDGFSTTTSSPSVSFTPASTAATGVYSLTVTYPGAACTSAPVTTGTVTVANYPVAYNITGGNGCSASGITVGVNNSQSTVSYELKRNGTSVSTSVGTGSAFDFAPVTTTGIYSVIGTGPGGCQTTMNGTDTVNTTPAITLGGMPSICQPTTSPTVAFSGAVGSPLTYSIDWSGAANAAGINDVANASLGASPITLAIPASGALGYYTGNVTVANAYCVSGLLPVHITIYANPTASVTSVDQVCSNHDGYIHFAGVDSASVNYTIDGGSVNTFVFSGSTTSLSTGILTAPKTYIIQSAYNPVCSTTINDTFTVNPTPMAWVGGQAGHESEWAYNANWTCGFAPTVVDDVEIGSATYAPSVATSAVANTRNLKLTSGSALLINSGGVVNVKGTLDNISTVSGDGKVVMNNTTAQTIRGIGTVSNLELDNTNGATIDAASRLMISKALYITHGTLTTNDSLELLSSDTFAAARIAELPSSGATISGKVKVDQYIQGGYRRFRFWSHPFSDTISLSQLQNYIDITGTGGSSNGFRTTGSNAASAFRFDTYTSCDTFGYDPGWKPFTKINSGAADSNKLHPYQGIRLFFRGTKGEGLGYAFGYTPSPVTVKEMGNVNQGDQIITLARGATSYQEYNLIGNPYPSPVDIGTILYEAQESGDITGSAFYVWDPSVAGGGQYLAIDLGVGAPAPYYLQANAAFQVRADHDLATLTFHESHKVATVDNYLFKSAPTSVSLNVYDVNYHLWDKLKLKFNDAATDNEDGKYDATKPMGTDFSFYSMSAEGRKLAIDARPYNADKVIPLGVRSGTSQDFIVRAENVVVPDNGTIYLHDKLLQKYVELTAGTEYHFTITNDKATQGDDRFEISMKPGATVATVKGLAVSMTPNPATDDVKISFTSGVKEEVKVRVLDMSGVSIYNENLGMKQSGVVNVPLSNFAAGIYMVELTQGTQKVTQKLVKE